jgi:hypothetical protein
MHDGRLVLQGPIDALLARADHRLFLRVSDLAKARAILAAEGLEPTPEGDGLLVPLAGGAASAGALNRRLVNAGVDVFELSQRQGTLESLYLQVQTQQAEAA